VKTLSEAERLSHLWRETVYQAVRDLKGDALERAAALDWVFSESREPQSFLWACEAAGLKAEDVRAEVKS
jgi:hypothetical protein